MHTILKASNVCGRIAQIITILIIIENALEECLFINLDHSTVG